MAFFFLVTRRVTLQLKIRNFKTSLFNRISAVSRNFSEIWWFHWFYFGLFGNVYIIYIFLKLLKRRPGSFDTLSKRNKIIFYYILMIFWQNCFHWLSEDVVPIYSIYLNFCIVEVLDWFKLAPPHEIWFFLKCIVVQKLATGPKKPQKCPKFRYKKIREYRL